MSPMVNERKPAFAADYIQVHERIAAFYAKHPEGSLQSELVELGEARVVMRAYAYRTPSDERPGIGYSSLEIPGRTPYTRGSEIENCETSAWGRAIAALGFEVKRGIATAEEVRNKSGEPKAEPIERDGDGLIGTVEIGKAGAHTDYELRQTPAGYALGFRLVSPAGGIKVVATGLLAEELATYREQVVGARVTCWGQISDEEFTPKGARRPVTYQVLTLARIRVPDIGDLPSPEPEEAPSIPLFSPDEEAAIAAAVDAAPGAAA